ncbi:trypsin-like peptidase domain-containing protein [bacterium]|nr:trypsin-like peptidase domain-containing protein [bacterium]
MKYFFAGLITGGAALLVIFAVWQHEKVENFVDSDSMTVPAVLAQYNDFIENSRKNAITQAIETASPAVVGINVIQIKEYILRPQLWDDPVFRYFFPAPKIQQQVQNLGSGFLISPDGYIITNEHVVHGAVKIIVTMSDGTQHNAEIIGNDYLSDIALLKIKSENLPYLPWGDSDDVIIGEWSIAIGNPFGLFSNNAHPTVTVGVISAVDRDFELNRDGKLYQDMIQTDASINPGNSGGPLLNSLGQVVGMNTMIFSESGGSIGLGFAIPANKIREIVEALKVEGEINRNYWIGIAIQSVNPQIAATLGQQAAKGVVVTDIDRNSPAEKGGIKITDVILSINGNTITNQESVRKALSNADIKVGDSMTFEVFREGETKFITIKLEELPKQGQ